MASVSLARWPDDGIHLLSGYLLVGTIAISHGNVPALLQKISDAPVHGDATVFKQHWKLLDTLIWIEGVEGRGVFDSGPAKMLPA
ncbi:hypothetical protein M8818_003685 [Zalaria obscura]|uniref:Uncharacterized protein n=1 Tax=Zalaria obscura TaxID=2024903 RepID=A0ACC3SFX4_9PEZI